MKRLLRALLLLAAMAVLAAALGLAWLLGTQDGLRWALRFAPSDVVLENPRGTLATEVALDRVAYAGSEARAVSLRVDLHALLAGTIALSRVRIESLRLVPPQSGGTGGEAGGGPVLPLRVRLSDVAIAKLAYEDYELRDITLEYSGGPLGHDVEARFAAFGTQAKVKAVLAADAELKELQAAIESLDLAALGLGLPHTALKIELQGRPTRGSKLSGTLEAANAQPGPLDRDRIPLARAQLSFATDFESVGFQDLRAALAPAGSIVGEGHAGRADSALRLRVRDLDLRAFYSTLRRTRLAGELQALLEPARQRVQGTLAQDDLSLTAEAERTGERIEVRSLRARAAGGEARGSARFRLGEPLRFEAALDLERFDPARFGDYPSGSINGALGIDGEWGAGARAGRARWDVKDSSLAGRPLSSRGRASFEGAERLRGVDAWLVLGEEGEQVRLAARGGLGAAGDRLDWTLEAPKLSAFVDGIDGAVRASGSATGSLKQPRLTASAEASALQLGPVMTFDRATLEAAGTLERHEASVTARNADFDLTGRLAGGWRGAAGWRGELRELRNAGRYPLALKTPATLEAGRERVALGPFDAALAGGGISAEGVRWENGRLSTRGAYRALPAQWILSLLQLDKPPVSTLLLDGDWDLVSAPRLSGRISAKRASGDLALPGPPARELGLERAALEARFTDGRIAASLDVASRVGNLRAEGRADGIDPQAAMSFTADVELADLRSLTEPVLTQARISGKLSASLKGSGTLGAPKLAGSVRGDELALDVPPYGIALRAGRLRGELEGDRLRVTEAVVSAGEGRFSASGLLPLRAAEGGASLDWRAEQFRIFDRPDLRLVVSGDGRAGFDARKLALHGRLRVDLGRIEYKESSLPRLGDDVQVDARPPAGAQGKRAPLPVDLDLQLDLGDRLALRALGFDGRVAGQVHLTSQDTGAVLAKGRVRAVNARFRAYGQELEVDPGSLLFDGPVEKPGLDISAWRRHQQVEAGVHVTGTPEAPRVELISNPPVPEQEKLSWLVLGRAPAGGADLAVLEATTGALLGSGSDPSLSRRIASRVGLDELTVRSSSELSANVFALGKRLSDQLYVGFEQTLGATTEYLVKVDYALTQRLSLRGTTGTTSGIGVFFRYSWD